VNVSTLGVRCSANRHHRLLIETDILQPGVARHARTTAAPQSGPIDNFPAPHRNQLTIPADTHVLTFVEGLNGLVPSRKSVRWDPLGRQNYLIRETERRWDRHRRPRRGGNRANQTNRT
jgi:hypothetical protein